MKNLTARICNINYMWFLRNFGKQGVRSHSWNPWSSYMGLPSQSSRSHSRESLKTEWKLPHPKVPHLHSMKAWWNVPTAVCSTQPMNTETCSSMSNTAQSSRTVLNLCTGKVHTVSYVGLWALWITDYIFCTLTYEGILIFFWPLGIFLGSGTSLGCFIIGCSDRMWWAVVPRLLALHTVFLTSTSHCSSTRRTRAIWVIDYSFKLLTSKQIFYAVGVLRELGSN